MKRDRISLALHCIKCSVFCACRALVFSRAGVIDSALLTLEFQSLVECMFEVGNVISPKYSKIHRHPYMHAHARSHNCELLFCLLEEPRAPLLLSPILGCTLPRVTFVRRQPWEERVLILSL